MIPVPFPPPAGYFTILAGDWFKLNHTDLKAILASGHDLPFPDGLLINGCGSNGFTFTVDQVKAYRFRLSNVGLTTSINFRIQGCKGHKILLVEAEGTHTLQNTYSSLDIHLGQSYSVLVTADQPEQDYYIVVSTRFTSQVLTTTSILHYSNSARPVSGLPSAGPTIEIDRSLNQARSIRQNLTASGPRPNPQGSYHYGMVNNTHTIRLKNSAPIINALEAFLKTPLVVVVTFRLLSWLRILEGLLRLCLRTQEGTLQSWHIDGHFFFEVGTDGGLKLYHNFNG